MPARWYIEPEFLTLEAEKIFYKTWQPVGRREDVARAGDFFSCEVLDQPLVVVRNRAGELRAFYNVCPHRAAVVAQGRGNRQSLQCKYHGWTYDLDGKLLRAPEFEGVENWDANTVCLQPVRVAAWGPWIFVNLDPAAQPMSTILRRHRGRDCRGWFQPGRDAPGRTPRLPDRVQLESLR